MVSKEMVKESASRIYQNSKQPKYSTFTLFYVVIVVIAFIVMETTFFDNLPQIIRVSFYITFVLGSAIFGHSNVLMFVKGLNEILSNKSSTIQQKLDQIINLMVTSSYWAGKYFEELMEKGDSLVRSTDKPSV